MSGRRRGVYRKAGKLVARRPSWRDEVRALLTQASNRGEVARLGAAWLVSTADASGVGAKPTLHPHRNLLQGDFTAEASDHKWVADITEFACWDAKLLLAGIKDLHDQSIVGWSMGIRQTTDLVVNALVMALSRRHPDNNELIHHPARGLQYTSLEFSTRLADWCIDPSYSRSGTCFDNAAMESTWATLKREIHHIHGSWSEMTLSQLRTALFSYIETFYNRNRHQARLGHRTGLARVSRSQFT